MIFPSSTISAIRLVIVSTAAIALLSGCTDETTAPDLPHILMSSITLDDGAWVTGSDTVLVDVAAYRATDFMLANSPGFEGGTWQSMDSSPVTWGLTPGDGDKQVYVKFTGTGTAEDVVLSKTILLDTTPPDVSTVMPDPADGASAMDRPVAAAWTPAQDSGSGVGYYNVFCDTTGSPTALAWSDSTLDGEIWTLNRLTTYRWRVEAVDRAGNAASTASWTLATTAIPEAGVPIAAGTFTMGSPPSEETRDEDEVLHTVRLTRDFYISRYEITVGQYVMLLQWAYDRDMVALNEEESVVLDNMGGYARELTRINNYGNLIRFEDGVFSAVQLDRPMRHVTWHGASAYCDWLSLREGLPPVHDHADWSCNGGDVYAAAGYRLPTESEWEYAARAGATTAFYNGDMTDFYDDPLLDDIAWYFRNTYPGVAPVGLLEPNAWGLHDVLGNSAEWVFDGYEEYPTGTPESPAVDPVSVDGRSGVYRGGCYIDVAWRCRLARRENYSRGLGFPGFRVVLTRP